MKEINAGMVDVYCDYFKNQLNSKDMIEFRNQLQKIYDANIDELMNIPINEKVIGDIKHIEQFDAINKKYNLQVDKLIDDFNLKKEYIKIIS